MTMKTSQDRTPVAQDIFTYCTKEKTDTWHVVRNHNVQGIVDKVICKSCGSEHKYRSPKAEKARKTPLSRSVIVRNASGMILTPPPKPVITSRSIEKAEAAGYTRSEALEQSWFKGLKKWGDKPVSNFSADTSYNPGDVFNHEVFGKGVVQARRENKIDVLFQAGLKTLPSRRQVD